MFANVLKHALFLSMLITLLPDVSPSQQYYPLDPGTVWNYRILHNNLPLSWDSSFVNISVQAETTLSNGHRYGRLNMLDVLGAAFVRADSSHIYYFQMGFNKENAMYNLRSQPYEGDSIHWGGLYSSRLISIDTTQFLGETVILRSYLFDGIIQYQVTLADKFGIVHAEDRADGGFPYNAYWDLLGCVVRDTTYGVIVSADDEHSLPGEFALEQNHPNPFNPVSTIGFSIAESRVVTLKVYDILGRELATLVNERKAPGAYEVTFDAAKLASGVYLYRLTAGKFVQTKSMVLVK